MLGADAEGVSFLFYDASHSEPIQIAQVFLITAPGASLCRECRDFTTDAVVHVKLFGLTLKVLWQTSAAASNRKPF